VRGADLVPLQAFRAAPGKLRVGLLRLTYGQEFDYLMRPLSLLPADRYEVHVFTANEDGLSAAQARYPTVKPHLLIPGDVAASVNVVRRAGVDVLINGSPLGGEFRGLLSAVLLARAAPVQVMYCSDIMTSGVPAMDYFLVGDVYLRDGLADEFTEEIVACPGVGYFFPRSPLETIDRDRARAELGLSGRGPLYVSTAHLFKITPELMRTWARLLQKCRRARLALTPLAADYMRPFARRLANVVDAACREVGVARERLLVLEAQGREAVGRVLAAADAYLDSFPYSGPTSAVEALLAGVPVVCLEGRTFRGTFAAGVLRTLALGDCVAASEAEYVNLARRLAEDGDLRQDVCRRIRDHLPRARFFHPDLVAGDLDRVLSPLTPRRARPQAPAVTQVGQPALGPRMRAALNRLLKGPALGPPSPAEPPGAAGPAVLSPAAPASAEPPRRLLFLSDCYAQDVVWGPFHKTMLAYLGAAFERVLAVRANAFFHEWSHRPYSEGHLAYLREAVRAFAPDLLFSVNRAGLCEQALAAVRPDVKAMTVFVDYYDRLDDSMHQYGPRDLIWGTGTDRVRREYLRKYAARLRPEQVIHTLWGVDHHLFYPREVERCTGIIFVGTPFNPEGFVNLLDLLSPDEHNRRVFLETYEAHRERFLYDWPAALRERGFAFDRLPPQARPLFENSRLQGSVCDQISIENRITCLAALAGLDARIYGDSTRQWLQDFSIANGRMLKHFQFRPVTDPDELVRLYCSSRIGVNIQHEHARGHGLSFRAFDLMACQTLLMTHGDSQEVLDSLGFAEDRDYACFRGPAELRRKCEFYLGHEGRRRAVAGSGYRKVRAGHTLAHRLAEVFSRFGYHAQAAHFARLSGDEVRARLDAERTLKEKVTTLPPLPAGAGASSPTG
jgi:hypothetical protein